MPAAMGATRQRERPEYYDFGRQSKRPQEEILSEICSELHDGDWSRFEADLASLASRTVGSGPIRKKTNTVLADLQWIRCHRKADRLPALRP